ncbi:FKBP-type peptidyl-prolyl cis-trans isomerase [Patescibacteria group bacterium]|nr:FKBP-type peptidyl-prolyl cis-trans isomerase [Patescibacteria group bacterium]
MNPEELPTELTVADIVVGTGTEAKKGDTVSVNYVGALPDGTVFDASANHGGPFSFQLGGGQVIAGWDQGLVGMKVGGKRTLIIPPDMAYGARAVGDVIPANATLLFEVELVGVQ